MQNYQQTSQSCKIKKIIKRLLYFSTIAGNTILYSEINLSEHVLQYTRNKQQKIQKNIRAVLIRLGWEPLVLYTGWWLCAWFPCNYSSNSNNTTIVLVCVRPPVRIVYWGKEVEYICPPTCGNCWGWGAGTIIIIIFAAQVFYILY